MLSFATLLGKNPRRPHAPKRFRQVGFDQLERRELLTGLPEFPSFTEFVDPGPQPPPTEQSGSPTEFQSSFDVAPPSDPPPPTGGTGFEETGSGFDEGGPGGSGFGESGSGFGEGGSGSGEGGSGFEEGGSGFEEGGQTNPPYIFDFGWSVEGNIYTFTGHVIDNQDPFMLTVNFGGLLSGSWAYVEYDGSFSFTQQLDEPFGCVTAITQDAEGLWSNQAVTYVA